MSPSEVKDNQQRGFIIPIGGGEDKIREKKIHRRFVELSGGENSDIVVIPTASRLESTGPDYNQIFRELGAGQVEFLPITSREDCDNPAFIEMLDRARQAAQAARKIAVVEVLGDQAGWLALQAGFAACADVVLIPEIPCDLHYVAARLKEKVTPMRPYGLVVVAEGAKVVDKSKTQADKPAVDSLKASLSPLATGEASDYVIKRSGKAAETVATELQLLIAEETYPLVIGPWVRGGKPTAVDRQLGMAYGAGAVQALKVGSNGVMVAFVPPEINSIPLMEAINKIRTVPADSEFMKIAHSLGICLGREV